MNTPITRRTALRGLGTLVALPFLESLAPAATSVAAASKAPKRLAFLYVPNGIDMKHWTPSNDGKLGSLTGILSPLNKHRDAVNVMSGLELDKAWANGDGGGDHARAMSAFLTGSQPRKTSGADIHVGQSADQYAATMIGKETRFASLELGIENGLNAGNCDSGYSCAYSANLSWRSPTTPNAKECDPKQVFDRLFAGDQSKEDAKARAKRDQLNQSVLDFVMQDAKALTNKLGQGDQRKLDEYLTSVREVEQRVERSRNDAFNNPIPTPNLQIPKDVTGDLQAHIRLMTDLMVLSFQSDLTRIITMPFANDGSNRSYKMIGVNDGHHSISHHGRNAEKLAKISKINTFHVEQLAYLMDKMDAVKEADGSSLLDNLMLVYGSGLSDGDRHNHDDLPILLLGKGGGSYDSGRHLKFSHGTPLMNLYLALFERLGCPATSFGDSTGVLKI